MPCDCGGWHSDAFADCTVGRNREAGNATNALLVETSLALRERDTWFGRFEWAEKAAEDLGIHDSRAIYDVAKLQLGYTAYFLRRAG